MKQYKHDDVEALQELVSEEFGNWSQPVEVSQDMVNQFAELTGDDYWIHTDPEKAKTDSPFGCTIAHGFLTLVLMPKILCGRVYSAIYRRQWRCCTALGLSCIRRNVDLGGHSQVRLCRQGRVDDYLSQSRLSALSDVRL